ncbi:porin [Psychrobacter sp. I-STPA10]|uniref:porin n=1 Tax=Psychrobacter sp. I-STPA10 TaxID=2585769 RepID=UPI001E38F80D|nr:porin [Psychrobacter sp. I-STPA10]
MKKLLLASAVAALSVSAAQAAPTVYGKVFLTVDAQSTDTDTTDKATNTTTSTDSKSRPGLNSNASRIGFKGGEALTANTDLIYQLEYGVDVANGGGAQFNSRDTYLGLANAQLGTIMAGRLTAIDGAVDYANVTAGGVLGGDGVQASFDAPRANNAFAYASPDYDGMQVLAMYSLDADKSGREFAGIAGKYEPAGQPFKAGASYIHGASAGVGSMKDAIRVSGAYTVSPEITVGALYQVTDYETDDKENAFTVSGEMATATPWTAYAQGDMVSNVSGAKDADAFRVAVGGKYAFNKATTGHVYGAFGKTEEENIATKTEMTGFGIGGGLEYKF